MSYSLLWLETLIVSLLWVTTVAAVSARWSRKWFSWLPVVLAFLVPLSALGALTALTASFKFGYDLQENWFWYTLSLLLAYTLGAVVIVFIGSRRSASGFERARGEWPRGRLSLATVTALAVGAMTFWNMDLAVRSQAAVTRTEAGAIMLEVSPPNVPDSQNAAFLYEKAAARLQTDTSLANDDSPLRLDHPDPDSPAGIDLLKRHALTIKFLRQAATLPYCRFDHDYAHPSVSMLLPEMNGSRTSAELLRFHARSELLRGNVSSAIIDDAVILHLGRAVGAEPMIISSLVAIGLDGLATNLLQEILPSVTRSQELSGLNLTDSDSITHLMRRSFHGEEALGLAIFSDLASGQLSLGALQPMRSCGNGGYSTTGAILEGEPFPTLFRVFFMTDDLRAYRQLMDEYQQQAAQPYSPTWKPTAQLDPVRFKPRKGLLTSLIVPSLSRALETASKAQAMHSAAQVAVAMTRYRLEHGPLPATWEALIPNYLDEVPPDPFDGQPLRLVHKGDKWLIYSIGPDLKDDGGEAFDSKTEKGDITFTLKKAPQG